jgi:hypothetical protein
MWLRVFRLLGPAPQLADMFAGTVFKLATEALLMQKPWTLVRHSFSTFVTVINCVDEFVSCC